MGKNERYAYLEAVRGRYRDADREHKSIILGEFCQVCGYNRKYAIRILNRRRERVKGRPGRRPVYGTEELQKVLRRIWLATDQMCSKKLVSAIPLWLPFYQETYGKVSVETGQKILSVSAATIDRLLLPTRLKRRKKGLGGTKPGSLLRNQIPLRTDNWDISEPGYLEADTVAHCGNSLFGDFIWSLTLTDIHSGWTECRATWNNGAHGVIEQIKDVEGSLAFPLQGFDCDNGSEFLNHHLLRYFTDRKPKIKFTRSRPYRKNDNAHVEQKNWSFVRHLLGYDRLEDPRLVELINTLYRNEWSLYQNHFCPTFKLLEKKRRGSKYLKKYESPQTPYQRLINSNLVAREKKEQLQSCHKNLNPFILKRKIEEKLRGIFSHVKVTTNVRQRL